MSRSVTIQRQTSETSRQGNYRTDLTITSGQDITQYLLVKQRIINPDGTLDDIFAAVASPAQLEDIPANAPDTTSYYRDYKVSLVSSDSEQLRSVVDQILADIQLTVTQLNELDMLAPTENIVITADSITVNN